MRVSIKYILGLWVVLLAIVGFLLYNAYAKLKPEIFISILQEQVQRNYPGTRLEVGKVDYRLSVDFNMGLRNILLKRADKVIGSLEEIELRLPWWLLLFQRGNAQVNLQNLTIFIDEDHEDPATADVVAPGPKGPNRIRLTVPDYLAKAQFTLRAKAITIKDIHGSRRYVTINKLLVREFRFGKNSAFELNLPVVMSHNDTSYNSELWLFGDITPDKEEWDLKFRGEFRTSEAGDKLQLDDVIIDGKARFKPQEVNVASDLTFFIERKQIGAGTFKATDKELSIGLTFSDFPLTFLSLFENEIKNPYIPQLTERSQGSVEIRKIYKSEALKLDGSLNFPGSFKLAEGAEVPGKWRITFNGSKWETSFITPKGEVSFFRRSVIDFKSGGPVQYYEEIGFTDCDLATAVQVLAPFERFLSETNKTYSSSTVTFKKCLQGESSFDGSFRYGAAPDRRFYVADLKDAKSSLKINFEQAGQKSALTFEAEKFAWIPQYTFLAPYFNTMTGTLDGKLEGRWTDSWIKGQWLSKLKAQGLTQYSGAWSTFFDRFWKVFNLTAAEAPDQTWNLSLKNSIVTLEPLQLDGLDPARLTGQLDLSMKKRSSLVLAYPKNKKWKPVRKELSEPLIKASENE